MAGQEAKGLDAALLPLGEAAAEQALAARLVSAAGEGEAEMMALLDADKLDTAGELVSSAEQLMETTAPCRTMNMASGIPCRATPAQDIDQLMCERCFDGTVPYPGLRGTVAENAAAHLVIRMGW